MRLSVRACRIGLVWNLFLIFSFTFLFVISSKAKIPLPFTPVPITFQTLVLFLAIAVLKENSIYCIGLYIGLGLLGWPFFSGGGGFSYIFGPTGGYLAGFLSASLIFSPLLRRLSYQNISFGTLCLLFFCINLWIYLLGVLWLKSLLGITLRKVLAIGVLPFIFGDLVKIFIASSLSIKFLRKKC
ncbi:MAG: biotin transporter BioY [Candidatus Omnitrophica bacterium]|nr:biotin transporter BioY [Candidatus Omnitrophota bacterium]